MNNIRDIEKELIQKINQFENSNIVVDRNLLLEVARALNIHYKDGSIKFQDKYMQVNSGKNINPKIINIDNIFGKDFIDRKTMSKRSRDLSLQIYTRNKNGSSIFINVDTETKFSIGRSGINDTFSTHKNRDITKFNTANKLHILGEQGIYFITTQTPNDVNNIKYHHFLTPVKIYDNDKNAIIHSVIREFPKDKTRNNGFYYHRIDYFNDKKRSLSGCPNQ